MRISVYITSYNQKEFLNEAIESVLNQSLKPFEIIVVDDCSSDGSQELIKSFANKYEHIRYILHEKNLGVAQVRISALTIVKGDFVTYVDGDDLYLPNKLETEAKLISEGNYNLSFSNNMYVDPDDINDVKWIWANNKNQFLAPGNMYVNTLTRNFPNKSLFRMELVDYNLLKKTGFHDPKLNIYEDYDLRIRLSKTAKINYSIIPTTKIRISKRGLSKSNLIDHYNAFQYIFNKYEKDLDMFDEPERRIIEEKLKRLLEEKRPDQSSKETSYSHKIKVMMKNNLIGLIQRM